MKIILLFLCVLILISKAKSFRTTFKSRELLKKDIKDNWNEQIKGKDEVDKCTTKWAYLILVTAISLIYLLFYILSAVYLNSFICAILSVIEIVFVFRDLLNSILITNGEDFIIRRVIWRFINLVVDLGYVTFVLYNLSIRW